MMNSFFKVYRSDKNCQMDSVATDRQIPGPNHDLILSNLSPTDLCARAINLEVPLLDIPTNYCRSCVYSLLGRFNIFFDNQPPGWHVRDLSYTYTCKYLLSLIKAFWRYYYLNVSQTVYIRRLYYTVFRKAR